MGCEWIIQTHGQVHTHVCRYTDIPHMHAYYYIEISPVF